jgi:hypothetical protein
VAESFHVQHHRYTWPDGSRCFVVSGDSNWEMIQGVEPDLVIIDEECDVKLWRELQMRRRAGTDTRYCILATSTSGLRWMYSDIYRPWLEFHKAMGIDEATAMRVQAHHLPGNPHVPWIWCWPRGGIGDNRVASAQDISEYRAKNFNSAAERMVRLGGGFLDFSGTPVFEPESMDMLRAHIRPGRSGRVVQAGAAA